MGFAMPTTNRLLDTITDGGYIAPRALADVLRVTQTELSNITGLRREAVSKSVRARSLSTQQRLRETVEILHRVSDWCSGPVQALAWFRSQPLPSFGDLTAEDLLKAGRADDLKAYLRRVADGGYA